ncbi:MAG: hypothetical protein AB2814_05875, partial [Candidatus Sedimenticola endophacoides]
MHSTPSRRLRQSLFLLPLLAPGLPLAAGGDELSEHLFQECRSVYDPAYGSNAYSGQECRYLVKDFGTSQSPKSTRQRDSRYCPD